VQICFMLKPTKPKLLVDFLGGLGSNRVILWTQTKGFNILVTHSCICVNDGYLYHIWGTTQSSRTCFWKLRKNFSYIYYQNGILVIVLNSEILNILYTWERGYKVWALYFWSQNKLPQLVCQKSLNNIFYYMSRCFTRIYDEDI